MNLLAYLISLQYNNRCEQLNWVKKEMSLINPNFKFKRHHNLFWDLTKFIVTSLKLN